MREGVPSDLAGVPKRTAQANDAIPKVAAASCSNPVGFSNTRAFHEECADRESPSFLALSQRCQDVCFKEGLLTWQECATAVIGIHAGSRARERAERLLQLAEDRRKAMEREEWESPFITEPVTHS